MISFGKYIWLDGDHNCIKMDWFSDREGWVMNDEKWGCMGEWTMIFAGKSWCVKTSKTKRTTKQELVKSVHNKKSPFQSSQWSLEDPFQSQPKSSWYLLFCTLLVPTQTCDGWRIAAAFRSWSWCTFARNYWTIQGKETRKFKEVDQTGVHHEMGREMLGAKILIPILCL